MSRKEVRNLTKQHHKTVNKMQHENLADKNYTLSSHSESFKMYKDKLCLEAIDCELTRENYKEKFHHLLCWEEMEHCRMLERLLTKINMHNNVNIVVCCMSVTIGTMESIKLYCSSIAGLETTTGRMTTPILIQNNLYDMDIFLVKMMTAMMPRGYLM